MLYVPIILGGMGGFGITGVLSRDLQKATLAGIGGAGIQVLRQVALTQFEKWLEKQLLYRLYLFSGTRLYSMLATGARGSWLLTSTAGAVTAGVLVGATVGSVGAIVAEEAGLISKQQEADALGFYTGGIRGDQPNYWNTDANDSGYFNVPKNISTIWNYYF